MLYRVVRTLVAAFCRLYFRLTIEGTEHLPPDRPFVLAPVHRSWVDFALVCGVTSRGMRYMGKAELWKFKPLGAFVSALGAYPVRRGGADREALRTTIWVVEEGTPVVIFPEGTRRSGPVVEDLFEGAAYVAARTGVPVVPVGIGGSERAMRKGQRLPRPVKVHIVIGPPLDPPVGEGGGRPSRRQIKELTAAVRGEVQRLFDEAQAKAGVV